MVKVPVGGPSLSKIVDCSKTARSNKARKPAVKAKPGGIKPLAVTVACRPSSYCSTAEISPGPCAVWTALADTVVGRPISQWIRSKSKVISSVEGSP